MEPCRAQESTIEVLALRMLILTKSYGHMCGIGVLIKIYLIKPRHIDIDNNIGRAIAIALTDKACKKSKAGKIKVYAKF